MSEIKNVAIVGAGTIGLSWAAFYARAGLSVTVSDPREDIADVVNAAMPELAESLRATSADLMQRIEISASLAEAVANADLVQENGPERLDLKQQLFADIAAAAPAGALLTSSSSGIIPTKIAEKLDNDAASRLLIAHPFNPPQLMALVEIVGGERTSEASLDAAQAFYAGLGKTPVRVHKEIGGFVANRLQEAVLNEAFSLVLQGVVSVSELDTAMRASLGSRWATIGPLKSFHLGGGPGGARHMAAHLGGGVTGEKSSNNTDDMAKLVDEIEKTYGAGAEAYSKLTKERDARQIAITRALNELDNESK